jgi:cellulose synthase (UDP-forming)
LGYFDFPEIGYVQLPQVYYNQPASFVARGAAEETYGFYSTTQMASYSLGFPISIGCHNSHRKTALKDVGGFPPHDADDLLITLVYRSGGWQGIYIPKICAKGLTPTDWAGYLPQQLRWARSVLDVKFRAYPKLAGKLPLTTRLISALHGLFYVQEGISGIVTLGLMEYMLLSGASPEFLSYLTMKHLLLLMLVFRLTDFYRQRFFLDPQREWGLHLRSLFLRFAKWPIMLQALVEAITGKKHAFALTVKVDHHPTQGIAFPHLCTALIVGLSWGIGVLQGYAYHPLLLLWTLLFIALSLATASSAFWRFPPPYDDSLLTREWRI